MMKVTFLGHSGFLLDDLLIDPFLEDNPMAPFGPKDIKAKLVCVTHGHHDHLGDAFEIAKNNNAVLVGVNEIASMALDKGLKAERMNTGGEIKVRDWRIKLTEALHSTDIGHAAGFLLQKDGLRIYHAGDTGLFGDMRLIGEEGIHIAMLPIGGRFTMGVDDAVRAIRLIRPKTVIPMHYGTFPAIDANPHDLAIKAGKEAQVSIMKPGETREL